MSDRGLTIEQGFDLLTQRAKELSANKIIELRSADSPLVVALPHAGTWMPRESIGHVLADRTLLLDTDLFTDRIFSELFKQANWVRTRVNPYVVNCNRAPGSKSKPIFPRTFIYGQNVMLKSYSAEQKARLKKKYYIAYHDQLKQLIKDAKKNHGFCLHIDGHALSHIGGPYTKDPGERRASFTIGDNRGKSASARLTRKLIASLSRHGRSYGFTVSLDEPYAGGYSTRFYGQPRQDVHSLQIEVNKDLYMNDVGPGAKPTSGQEFAVKKTGLARTQKVLRRSIEEVVQEALKLYR